MALTHTLASHVEQHRKNPINSAAAAAAGGGKHSAAAAAAAAVAAVPGSSSSSGGGDAVATVGVQQSGIDCSLVGCLAKLREPVSGELFSHQALQAELFLETVGQESIPWTMAWTL
jgi:hypothetical protein